MVRILTMRLLQVVDASPLQWQPMPSTPVQTAPRHRLLLTCKQHCAPRNSACGAAQSLRHAKVCHRRPKVALQEDVSVLEQEMVGSYKKKMRSRTLQYVVAGGAGDSGRSGQPLSDPSGQLSGQIQHVLRESRLCVRSACMTPKPCR